MGKQGKKIKCQDLDICAISSSHHSLGKGRITIDSGAAESVLPRSMLKEVQLRESEGSRNGMCFKVANGGKMPNYGEKKVNFQMTANRQPKGIHAMTFQVTDATKPLAAVSKIVKKGNRVIFDPEGSYVQNIKSGQKKDLSEVGGIYQMDVE